MYRVSNDNDVDGDNLSIFIFSAVAPLKFKCSQAFAALMKSHRKTDGVVGLEMFSLNNKQWLDPQKLRKGAGAIRKAQGPTELCPETR